MVICMRLINMKAVFLKQMKETLKNKEVLVQFMMFPLIALVMENLIHVEGMPENFFVNMFSAMYVGMAPLVAMVSILAEEKEKGTLRVLLMANVKSVEYLAGVGSYVWTACMIGACVFMAVGNYKGKTAVLYLFIMAIGIFISMVLGAAIGAVSRNQMAATAVSVPVMLVLSFLPMLSTFNETVEKAARFVYTQQISILVNRVAEGTVYFQNISIILINVILTGIFFVYAYQKAEID